MTFLDTMLLDLVEHLCRRFQALTGRTNVWLAIQLTNLSIVLYFAWAGAYIFGSRLPFRIVLAVFCAALLFVLSQTVLKVPIEASEQNAYRRVAKGLRNPRRVRDALLRLQFLALTILLAGPVALAHSFLQLPLATLGYSLVVLTTVLLYVVACDPLPPCAGRVTEWLRRLVPGGVAAEQGPAPDPVQN
jgi:hypothetical protein